MIDLAAELTRWLSLPEVKSHLVQLMREAVRSEVRAALDDELIDTTQAAQILAMSSAALRKAVERGQIPCVRVGRRIRFRRAELLRVDCR